MPALEALRLNVRPFAPIALVVLALTQSGVANACYLTTSEADATVKPPFGFDVHYVVVDELGSCGPDCVLLPVVWLYQETNTMPGLQRHDFRHSDVHNCSGDPSQWSDAIIL